MKPLSTLLVATALSGAVGIVPVFAQPAPATTPANATQQFTPMTDADRQEYKGMLQDAYTMMGHIGIANIALMYNLPDEAANNTQQALTIARKLEGQTTQLNADVLKVGKMTYHNAKGESHDYWLPVVDDTFVVNNLDAEYLKSKQPEAVEDDAQMVQTKVVLDVKQARDSLEKAATAISAKNYTDAQADLITAEQSTFTDETFNELPLQTTRDDLVLAKELTKGKDYDGASFALTHAKDALTEYRKTAVKGKSAEAHKLQTEISALQTEISKDRPSAISKMEKRIDGWMHKVEILMGHEFNLNNKQGN